MGAYLVYRRRFYRFHHRDYNKSMLGKPCSDILLCHSSCNPNVSLSDIFQITRKFFTYRIISSSSVFNAAERKAI